MNNRNAPRRQHRIQTQVSRTDRAHPKRKLQKAMQAGARDYPAPPFPRQHQPKPGSESKLDPAPMYDAPFYRGSGKLQDKVALISGGDSGIGRAVAILFAREGANIALAHLKQEQRDAEITKLAWRPKGGNASSSLVIFPTRSSAIRPWPSR